MAVKDDETERSAIAFLREAAKAFPFRLTYVLTDNGSCFTPAFARVCAELGAEYRHNLTLDLGVLTSLPLLSPVALSLDSRHTDLGSRRATDEPGQHHGSRGGGTMGAQVHGSASRS